MLATAEIARLGECLARRGERLFVIEAGSGGALQAALSAPPGASAWFMGGLVCYADALKLGMLGVEESLLVRHGAVSPQVVAAMAKGALARVDADWVLVESGVYGPAGGSPEKPVGLVQVHIAHRGADGVTWRWMFSGGRAQIRRQLIEKALARLERELMDADASANLG